MNHKLFDLFFVLFLNHAIVHLFLDSEIGYGLARYDDHKGFFWCKKTFVVWIAFASSSFSYILDVRLPNNVCPQPFSRVLQCAKVHCFDAKKTLVGIFLLLQINIQENKMLPIWKMIAIWFLSDRPVRRQFSNLAVSI